MGGQGTSPPSRPDTGASVTIARPNITTGLIKRKPCRPYFLEMMYGETLPVLVELTLGWTKPIIWVFISKIKDEFILGLHVLRAYDVVVDLKHHVL
jgi:hypothetical protein